MQSRSPQQTTSEYEFILSPQQKHRAGNYAQPPKKRLILSALFITGVFIIIAIAFSIISSIGAPNTGDLKSLAAQQTEIARIADVGLDSATSPDTINTLISLRSIAISDRVQIQQYLQNNGSSLDASDVAAAQNADTDSVLAAAENTAGFDDVALNEITKLAEQYAQAVAIAIQSTPENAVNRQSVLQVAAENIADFTN